MGASLRRYHPIRRNLVKVHRTVAAAAVAPAVASGVEEVKE